MTGVDTHQEDVHNTAGWTTSCLSTQTSHAAGAKTAAAGSSCGDTQTATRTFAVTVDVITSLRAAIPVDQQTGR